MVWRLEGREEKEGSTRPRKGTDTHTQLPITKRGAIKSEKKRSVAVAMYLYRVWSHLEHANYQVWVGSLSVLGFFFGLFACSLMADLGPDWEGQAASGWSSKAFETMSLLVLVLPELHVSPCLLRWLGTYFSGRSLRRS